MKALILALALALAPQTATKPTSPPVVTTAPAAPAKPGPVKAAPARPAPPPSSDTLSPSDALALCRSNCAQTHFQCLQAEDDTICNPGWLQCRAKCARANPG